jgi:hypothetical protein
MKNKKNDRPHCEQCEEPHNRNYEVHCPIKKREKRADEKMII